MTGNERDSTCGLHSTIWLDVIAAVDYIAEVHRRGFTVWDAVEEAIRWWSADRLGDPDGVGTPSFDDLPWDDPDPLRTGLERLFATVAPATVPDGHQLGDVLTGALTVWLQFMVNTYNDGHQFAHPTPARGWPGVSIEVNAAIDG